MSTVAAFLLMISSSLVRDLYQRVINPRVSNRAIKVGSYLVTGLVGLIVLIGALNPPRFLQYIIVFIGTGLGCAFLVPMLMTLYWRRATRAGVMAAMLGGFLTVASLYALGWLDSASRQSSREAALTRPQAAQPAPVEPGGANWLQDNLGWIPGWGEERHDPFLPLFVGGVDTLVWGLLVSLVLGVGVSRMTRPDPQLVAKYFPSEGATETPA
jgi:Na+/proline symporter